MDERHGTLHAIKQCLPRAAARQHCQLPPPPAVSTRRLRSDSTGSAKPMNVQAPSPAQALPPRCAAAAACTRPAAGAGRGCPAAAPSAALSCGSGRGRQRGIRPCVGTARASTRQGRPINARARPRLHAWGGAACCRWAQHAMPHLTVSSMAPLSNSRFCSATRRANRLREVACRQRRGGKPAGQVAGVQGQRHRPHTLRDARSSRGQSTAAVARN